MITPDDLKPFADIPEDRAQAMIDDALAMARLAAPCILEPSFDHADAVRSILRGAILRWSAAATGAVTSQSAGPFSVTIDSASRRGGVFWPSEIKQLQQLCVTGSREIWSYDTIPDGSQQ